MAFTLNSSIPYDTLHHNIFSRCCSCRLDQHCFVFIVFSTTSTLASFARFPSRGGGQHTNHNARISRAPASKRSKWQQNQDMTLDVCAILPSNDARSTGGVTPPFSIDDQRLWLEMRRTRLSSLRFLFFLLSVFIDNTFSLYHPDTRSPRPNTRLRLRDSNDDDKLAAARPRAPCSSTMEFLIPFFVCFF